MTTTEKSALEREGAASFTLRRLEENKYKGELILLRNAGKVRVSVEMKMVTGVKQNGSFEKKRLENEDSGILN